MTVAGPLTAPSVAPATLERDVVLVLSYTSWNGGARRGLTMPEDRLAVALTATHRPRRLLVCNPFRSHLAKLASRLAGRSEAPFPASATTRLHEPLRLRRHDSRRLAAVERSCATYEDSLRRAADELGLERPAVITTHPLIAGFCRFEWAGPTTYYATDDLAAYPPYRRWWPAYREAYGRMRERGRRVGAVSPAILERLSPTGLHQVIPNAIDPEEWLKPAPAPAWFAGLPGPRLLYAGSLDDRLDVEQLGQAAARMPAASFVPST